MRSLIVLIAAFLLSTCIDPYDISVKGYENILVVDALITDEPAANYVRLSRTSASKDDSPVVVEGARVTISDENGSSFDLSEESPGSYRTNSSLFRGRAGSSYTLYIRTPDGKEFRSETCMMQPVEKIDRIYFEKDREISDNGSSIADGIRFFIDSENSGSSSYLRWTYNESWKIIVPDPKRYDYINDSTIVETAGINQLCWGYDESDEIIISSVGSTEVIRKKPLAFVPTSKSTRFLIRYSIEVKQLSLSLKEYRFWDQMNKLNETGGDIFDKQPFPVVSNIHNISNPDEPVLGFFQVSAVSSRRIYINAGEISGLGLPLYRYGCSGFALGPDDYPPPIGNSEGMTFDKIYNLYEGSTYTFIEPMYDAEGKLKKLVFTRKTCADCTLHGIAEKPGYWTD